MSYGGPFVSPNNRVGLAQPGTYTVISISVYSHDLTSLDAAVEACKAAGVPRVNKSWLVRRAIERLDVQALIAVELAKGTR